MKAERIECQPRSSNQLQNIYAVSSELKIKLLVNRLPV